MSRIHNFSSGPSCLPEEVLREIRDEMLDWHGSGMSVLEMPFSCPEYRAIAAAAERDLRALLDVPASHHILFLQGGAYAHFGILAMNLLAPGRGADYVVTGLWSERAAAEAGRHGNVRIAASGAREGFCGIPPRESWQLDPAAAYCHLTTNETAHGVQFRELPDTGAVPLVADVTSDFLMQPIEVARCGLLYASAQKNAGCAGLTIVIVREDMLRGAAGVTPAAFDYRRQAECNGCVNTPPTFSVYCAGLMFAWMRRNGGVATFAQHAARRSARLYEVIDGSPLYLCPVEPAHRSQVNLCFRLPSGELEREFLDEAARRGLHHLEGHSAVGGVRVSLHNATPDSSVEALLAFMRDFAARRQAAA
ncbi:MAG: 3-phosphoserine/phosphohydroxythreonine transaminase [Gammaproteobacteria bacterium]